MPTALSRVQVLLQPDVMAKVRTLAKHNRRTMSAMTAELIEHALRIGKYEAQLEEVEIQVPAKADPRQVTPRAQFREALVKGAVEDGLDINAGKLKRLLAALELLDD